MKRKLDKNKVGFAIATVVTVALVINKIVQAGTIFCLTTIYQEEVMGEFFKNYGGYFIGILFTPVTYIIVKAIKRAFKSTINKEKTKKNAKYRDNF